MFRNEQTTYGRVLDKVIIRLQCRPIDVAQDGQLIQSDPAKFLDAHGASTIIILRIITKYCHESVN